MERIGIIGGTGMERLEGFEPLEERDVDTPFGKPSAPLLIGKLEQREVVFLRRHGVGHHILPSELNFRANIYAMKEMGVGQIAATGAVGSLREDIHPLDIVIPHQFIDRTSKRVSTFFGEGVVAHISFGNPVCPELARQMAEAARQAGAGVHEGGTYVCMEGPQFSTLGESELYRSWGASVIGMTNLQEAKLAREAEICYASMALVTDYDCWHTHEDVTVEMIIQNLIKNAAMARATLARLIPAMRTQRDCPCASALENAIVTREEVIPRETLRKLRPIIGKYVGDGE